MLDFQHGTGVNEQQNRAHALGLRSRSMLLLQNLAARLLINGAKQGVRRLKMGRV